MAAKSEKVQHARVGFSPPIRVELSSTDGAALIYFNDACRRV